MDEGLPTLDGYHMPPEWVPQARCWMAWPCRLSLWGEGFDAACRAHARVARAIAEVEPVVVLVPPALEAMARLQLGRKVELRLADIDDSWTRDTGPTFLVNDEGGRAGIAWRFNGWGNREHPHDGDARLGAELLASLDLGIYEGPMVLEGGAIDVDGAGALLATMPSVINPNRNPTLDERQIEERLALHLGAARIIWLPGGLVDDETDGHVDNVARFVAPGRVVAAVASDPSDRNHGPLLENLELLSNVRVGGRPLEVVELPLPAPIRAGNGQMPASYANFFIANGAVFVPRFDDPMDGHARAILAEQFPERDIVQLEARDILVGGGGLHCITLQEPA